MIDGGRRIILDKLVEALAEELEVKDRGHCERLDYLSREEAVYVCRALRQVLSEGIQAFVLGEQENDELGITSDQAIERRNRKESVLCVIIPADNRDPAASSLGNSFKPFDVQGFLRSLAEQVRRELPREFADLVRLVREQLRGRARPPTEHEIEFLDMVRRCSSVEEIGRNLWMVGLVPDLGDVERMKQRLKLNRECVEKLVRPSRPQMGVAERVASLGLMPGEVPDMLVKALTGKSLNDVRGWLKVLLDEYPHKLTFECWEFPYVEPTDLIAIELEPFVDQDGRVIEKCGLKQPHGPNTEPEIGKGAKLTVKWSCVPKRPKNVTRWSVSLIPDRDTYDPDQVAGVELPSVNVAAGRRTHKLEIDFDEDIEVRKVQVRVAALNELGQEIRQREGDHLRGMEPDAPIEAVSIPFGLSEARSEGDGEGPRRRSIENSLPMVKLRHALTLRRDEPEISLAWQPEERDDKGPLLYYPVLVNNCHRYRLASTRYLAELERHCLEHPDNLGRYRAAHAVDVLIEAAFEPVPTSAGITDDEDWRSFVSARERCFRNILRQQGLSKLAGPSREESQRGAVITLELDNDEEHRELRNSILHYLSRYSDLLKRLMDAAEPDLDQMRTLCSLDSLELEVYRTGEVTRALLMLPTHPLKLGWYLTYWDFMNEVIRRVLSTNPHTRRNIIDVALFERLEPHNLPAFACDADGNVYVNSGSILLLHSVMVPVDSPDPNGAVGEVAHMLGLDYAEHGFTTLSPLTVADRLKRFQKLHPYLPALRVHAVNPGRGAFVGEVLRQYAKLQEDDEEAVQWPQPLDLIVHGHASPQTPAPGLDQLVQDLQQELATRGTSHLLPIVQIARRPWGLDEVGSLPGTDVNVSIATDVFSPKLATIDPNGEVGASNCVEGLLTRWITTFTLHDSGCSWTRYVRIEDDASRGEMPSRRLLTAHDLHLRAVARMFNPTASKGSLPAVILSVGPEEKQLLNYLHDRSEWVFTIDRNLGVEFYDYPREPELSRESEQHIIDHVPEFSDGLGHRLIISTSWHEEAAEVLRQSLAELELSSDEQSVIALLRLIKAISGRLAMRVIGDPNHAREVVGLALVADYLRSTGELNQAILLPVDPHARVFCPEEKEEANLCCDLISIALKPKSLDARFIEVKFRTSAEEPSEPLLSKMVMQMEYTRDRFMKRYFPDPENPRPDHVLVRSELSSLLAYYLDRAWRHGWIAEREDYDNIRRHILRLESAYSQPKDACEGFLVMPNRPEPEEISRNGHRIRIIAHRSIEEQTQFRVLRRQVERTDSGSKIPPDSTPPPPPLTPSIVKPSCTTPLEQGAIPTIALGKSVVDDQEVGWTPSLQGSPHVLLVGSTGSGKSTTVNYLLHSLAVHKVPFIVLDFHGDLSKGLQQHESVELYEVDATHPLPFSPLEPVAYSADQPPNLNTSSYEVAEVLAFVCSLGEMQRDLVYRALVACYDNYTPEERSKYPSMRLLRDRLEELEREPGAPRNVVARCRQLLDFGLFADVTDGSKFEAMLRDPTCVVLNRLQIEQLQYAAVSFILRRIYRQMFLWGDQEQVRLLVVLDEAHRVAKDPTLPRLMKEGRKFGVAVIVASQEIHDFHEAVVHNAGTKVLFRTNYPESKTLAKYVQGHYNRGRDFTRDLEGLTVGHAFVQTQHMRHCTECQMYMLS